MSEENTNENTETSTPSKPASLTPHDIVRVFKDGGIAALRNERITRGQLSKAISVMALLDQPEESISSLKSFFETLPTQGGRGPAAVPGTNKNLLFNKQGQLVISGARSFLQVAEDARANVSYEEVEGVRRVVVTA